MASPERARRRRFTPVHWTNREWAVFVGLTIMWALLGVATALLIGSSWTLALLAAAAWTGGVFSGELVQRLGLTQRRERHDLG